MRLLVIEDDDSIAEPLCEGLNREGFTVQRTPTGGEGIDAVRTTEPDLVLLDLGLPDLDGRAVCRVIRAESAVPIIVVTARADEIDRVTLLELGADDYVVKPFGFRELVARIGAVLRRTTSQAPVGSASPVEPERFGPVCIDRRTRQVTVSDEEVSLTAKEFDLLAYLSVDAGAVRTRDEIIRDVWDENWWGSTKTLDVHVASLRKKLGAETIETIRGVGFRFAAQEVPG